MEGQEREDESSLGEAGAEALLLVVLVRLAGASGAACGPGAVRQPDAAAGAMPGAPVSHKAEGVHPKPCVAARQEEGVHPNPGVFFFLPVWTFQL